MATAPTSVPLALPEGLVLRWSSVNDTERIADLIGNVYRSGPEAPLNAYSMALVRLLMRGDHPLMTPEDFAVVEDVASKRLVACACLWRQTWTYAGVPLLIGRTEEVASDPEYHQRGLIRAIIGALHQRSEARGDAAQAIRGIRYFYHQFGYEYALERGSAFQCALDTLPASPDQSNTVTLRPARAADLPQIIAAYEHGQRRSLVAALPSGAWWAQKLATGEDPGQQGRLLAIVDRRDAVRGYVEVIPVRTGPTIGIRQAELADGRGWQAVAVPLLQALRDLAPTLATQQVQGPATSVTFVLGADHPLAMILTETVATRVYPPSAWYVRVPDLPHFLRRLRSAFADRLARSAFRGYSGELTLDFYRGGLRLTFAQGALVHAVERRRSAWGGQEQAAAAFPPGLFLQLLFGYRRLDQLRAASPDVWCSDDAEALVLALFPAAPSCVLPLD